MLNVSDDWRGWGRRLRRLRIQRGWSQRELAEKVGTSRNTINRWEIGNRHPSVTMLDRLTQALKVGIAALLPKDATAPAYRFTFDVRFLFPDGQAFSAPLIRLMMATDDARHLQKLLIKVRQTDGATTSDKAIVNGEIGHLFRLLCVPLFEAMDALETLDSKCPGLLDAAATDARAKDALQHVRREWPIILHRKGKRSFIDVVRNFVGAHYNEQKLWKALDKHARAGHLDGTLLMTPFQGLGRYTVTDQLALFLMADEMGGGIEEFQKKFMQHIGETIELVGHLGDVVDYLVGYIVIQPNQKIERESDTITIDPLIVRAKRDVDKERKRKEKGIDRRHLRSQVHRAEQGGTS